MSAKRDLTGQKFNYLTVIKESGVRNKQGCILWECLCDCGNITYARGGDITSGHKKSCGCLNTKTRSALGKANKIDMLNKRIGKLVVIRELPDRDADNAVIWECQCDCGNIIKAKGTFLRDGRIQSCGCLKSAGELAIIQLLKQNNITFETQKSFDSCRFDNNYLAKFDFYINNQYLIEYDGEVHYFYTNAGWNTKEHFDKTKQRDEYKNKWCKENNIPLIRIPYTHLHELKIEDLMLETSQFII